MLDTKVYGTCEDVINIMISHLAYTSGREASIASTGIPSTVLTVCEKLCSLECIFNSVNSNSRSLTGRETRILVSLLTGA